MREWHGGLAGQDYFGKEEEGGIGCWKGIIKAKGKEQVIRGDVILWKGL
jgi:hypothetical protein